MQQKLCSEGSGSFHDGERSSGLHSLYAQREYPYEYRGFSITGKLPPKNGGLTAARGMRRSLSDGRDTAQFLISRRRTRSVGTRAHQDELKHQDGHEELLARESEREKIGTSDRSPDHYRGFHLGQDLSVDVGPDWNAEALGQGCCSGPDTTWCLLAAPHGGLAASTIDGIGTGGSPQWRLARIRTELAQARTRLLCERAHTQHLSRERQEVAEKERSLSQQVDVAVMVIAALKEQINASENELERRERQVLSIHEFLETAARQETSGKVRIQSFIENLLRRIALAETLLEDYQRRQTPATNRDKPCRITKSRSAGCQLSCDVHGNAPVQRPLSELSEQREQREQRERLVRSSRLFCRPEHRDDIWNQRLRSAGYEA
ncbi:uncharacterized protein znf365 [Syngnathus scovelli]|uniref:uncharacterized protein znf365 n=1 Tax=Syngnathus scovelli TaxID=161590 RepID=UPI00210F4FB6|nr:uncharacterized protein znf365 [Syngnathus scovelli]